MARASIHLMNVDKKFYDEQISTMCSYINVGSGKELTIKRLAKTIRQVVGFKGKIKFYTSIPDGALRKFLDSKRINIMGFKHRVSF